MAAVETAELCEELDGTLLEVMDCLKQLSRLRNQFGEDVKEGYFTMSQARHAMGGPGHVSAVQYDSTMKSLVHINVDPLPNDKDSLGDFKVHRLKPGEVKGQSKEGVSGDGLRRRKGEESVEDVPMEEVREVKDPIKWFGILVPQNLRRSQQQFIQAIEHSCDLATAQRRLVNAQEKYQKLLAKKKELEQ